MADDGWTVVRAVDLSPSRRRLEYWIPGMGKRYATIDSELDSSERRAQVARALIAEDMRVKTPRGPQPAVPRGLSGWLDS